MIIITHHHHHHYPRQQKLLSLHGGGEAATVVVYHPKGQAINRGIAERYGLSKKNSEPRERSPLTGLSSRGPSGSPRPDIAVPIKSEVGQGLRTGRPGAREA